MSSQAAAGETHPAGGRSGAVMNNFLSANNIQRSRCNEGGGWMVDQFQKLHACPLVDSILILLLILISL